MSHTLYNLMITLPDIETFHDRFISWVTPKGSISFAVHVRLGGPPLTLATLEQAHLAGAGSRDPVDVSGRREMARGRL